MEGFHNYYICKRQFPMIGTSIHLEMDSQSPLLRSISYQGTIAKNQYANLPVN